MAIGYFNMNDTNSTAIDCTSIMCHTRLIHLEYIMDSSEDESGSSVPGSDQS